jgi:hypothetical protein
MKVKVTVKIEAFGGGAFVSGSVSKLIDEGQEGSVLREAEAIFAHALNEHAELHPDEHQKLVANAPLPAFMEAEVHG